MNARKLGQQIITLNLARINSHAKVDKTLECQHITLLKKLVLTLI